jgi:hypothetical protein
LGNGCLPPHAALSLSRLGRSPSTVGGDQGNVGNADTWGVFDRPYHCLADEDVDRHGLGVLASYVDERSLFQLGEPFFGARIGL